MDKINFQKIFDEVKITTLPDIDYSRRQAYESLSKQVTCKLDGRDGSVTIYADGTKSKLE